LYWTELAAKWAARVAWFTVTPVLSEPDADWQDATELVHDAALKDHRDLSGAQVCACGNPLMIRYARRDFETSARVPADQFLPIRLWLPKAELPLAQDIKAIIGIEAIRTEAVETPDVFNVPTFISSRRVGAVQYRIMILCGLVMFLDGFDTQSISYVVPLIAKKWGSSREVLGPIFSSALAGLMVGYLVLSPLSDRFGHRRLIIISTVTFALLTLITVLAASVTQLIGLRFVTGRGHSECVRADHRIHPKRLRTTFMLAIYCGFSLGFVAAGAMAAWSIGSKTRRLK
jgi:hypothetical protein